MVFGVQCALGRSDSHQLGLGVGDCVVSEPARSFGVRLSDMLLAMAEEHHAPLASAVNAYSAAMTAVRACDDVEDRMRTVGKLHLAAATAGEAFGAAALGARVALTTAMRESGCPGLYTAHHHVTLVEGARRLVLTDAAALAARHPELMILPPPEPDRPAITKLLRAGHPVEGASLSNGGEPTARFTSSKKGLMR